MADTFLSAGSPLNQKRRKTITDTTRRILTERAQARASRAAASLGEARRSTVTPDVATRGRQVSQSPDYRLLDPKVIDTLEDNVRQKRETKLLEESPRTAAWLSNVNNAMIAHDDVETVGFFESLGRAAAKRTDAIYDNARTSVALTFQEQARNVARDMDMTLDELIEDEMAKTVEKANSKVGPEDFRTKETLPWPNKLSSQAAGLWRWIQTAGIVDEDFIRERAEKSKTSTLNTLLDRGLEAKERELLWKTPEWRRQIETQIAGLEGQAAGDSLMGLLKIARDNPMPALQYLVEIGAESGLTIAAGLTAGAVTRSPGVAATTMGVGSATVSQGLFLDEMIAEYGYDITTKEGVQELLKDPRVLRDLQDKSKAYGMVVGIFDGLSAGMASKVLVNNPVGEFMLQTLAQGGMGGAGEALGRIAAEEEVNWSEVWLEALAETVTAPFEIGSMAMSGGRKKVAQVQNQRERQKLFQVLSGTADASAMKQRDQATFAAAIKEVTENGPAENLYVDPTQMEELFQGENSDMTLEEFFEAVPDLDLREFNRARDTGTQFIIPTSTYASYIAGTALDGTLQQHIRIREDDMSAAEAKQFQKDMVDAAASLEKNGDTVDSIIGGLEGPLATEFDRLRTEIVEAHGITPRAAEKQAAVLVASARAGAARARMTVSEYLRRYTLPTVRNADDVGPAPATPRIDPDVAFDMVTSEDGASTVPDIALIRERVDQNGVDPEVASRDDVMQAIRELQNEGSLAGELSLEDQATPGELDRADGEELMQTATLRGGEEDASAWGIDTSARNKVRDIALRLQERQRKLYGKTPRRQRGPKTVDRFAEWMADEIEFELQTPGADAVGWYTDKYQAALDRMASIFPEFRSGESNLPGLRSIESAEDARSIFTAILAITSNGTKVVDNFRIASEVYSNFRTTGRMEATFGQSDRLAHTKRSLARYQQILNEFGSPSEVRNFLLTELTVREANQDLKEIGLPPIAKLPADMLVPRSATIFGPKLGAFYANLSGSTGYLTMDLWWTRTINRYRADVLPKVRGMKNGVDSKGRPVGLHRFKRLIGRPDLTDQQALNYVTEYAQRYADKAFKNGTEAEKAANTIYKDAFVKLAEQPEGAADRTFMVQVAEAAREKVADRTGRFMSLADIQAIIWYYEKRLYADMGVRDSGDISYEEAAGIAINEIRRPKQQVMEFNQGPVTPENNTIREDTIVGPDGNPVMLFHGTNQQFREFRDGRIFFTNQKSLATEHALRGGMSGARIVEANVAVQNPLEVQTDTDPDVHWLNNSMSIERQMVEGGHDSVMVWNMAGELMVIATANDQVTQVNVPQDEVFNQDMTGLPALSADPLPDLEKASPGRVPGVREIATQYMQENGLPVRHQANYVKVDVKRATEIANLYDAMEHNPADPAVKAAYDALAAETIKQYEALLELGFTFEFIVGDDPYATPADAIRDMQENRHLWVFPTDDGFGTINEAEQDNPLLKFTKHTVDGRRARVNDLFRIVHDVFGHGSEGASFGPRGEENAWQAHVRMFSPLAARAMTTETRGQNSWVNYGPFGEQNRTDPKNTVFADQKTGLLPEWVSEVGQAEDVQPVRPATAPARLSDFEGELTLEAFQRPGWFVLSAARDDLGPGTSPENREMAAQLRKDLEEAGLDFKQMKGVYQGRDDGTSFLVIGSEGVGQDLGRRYLQESVLTREGLVYTDGSNRANVPFDGIITGSDAKREDYHSLILGGDTFSLTLQFPAAQDVAASEGAGDTHYGAKLRDGKMVLTRWDTERRDEVDPAFAGTGPLPGPERKRAGPNKSFFGLHVGEPGGYKRESSLLGDFRHEALVDPSEMYPWWQDPDNLKEKLDRSKTTVQQVSQYEDLIKAAGYKGYFVIGGPIGDTAVRFEKTAIDNVIDDNDAKAKRSAEFNAWFGDSVVVNEDGSPRMVFHGTRTDFSDFFTMSHFGTQRAANERLSFDSNFNPDTLLKFGRRNERLVPAYLSISRPLDLGTEKAGELGTWETLSDMIIQIGDTLNRNGFAVSERLYQIADDLISDGIDNGATVSSEEALREVAGILEDAGYDGVTYTNAIEDAGGTSYIALRPTQVKSPFNSGNWDANDPDILAQPNRGSIILPADKSAQAQINIFQKADLSTVLHESGHFFLWQLQRQRDDGLQFAGEQLEEVRQWWVRNADKVAAEAKLDTAQVEEYLTVGTTGSGSKDAAIHTALHEQFARGFEAYVMEGKSPSNALRAVFENFAAWLISIYRQAKNLNVDLDDGIRNVFDRMLATEEELAAGADREGINDSIAETAREMGLDEDAYRRLVDVSEEARDEGRQIARAEMLAAERKMRSQQYQARLAEIDAEEREKVNAKPVHRAIQWLGFGRWLGDDVPEGLPLELRMDTDLLVDEHGQDILSRLPRGRRPLHRKETGLSADEVAGWFGFGSGAEMLDAMVKAPKAREEIKANVDQRAREELGDIMGSPGDIEEAVVEAFHGEKRGQVIVAELRAINRLGGRKKMTSRAQAKQIAREMIQRMPVREAIRTTRFQEAERRHAEQASRLLAEGNVDAAFDAKRKQLIQHALYIESKAAADLTGKAERLAGRLKRKGTRENLAGEYLGAIDDILENYDFRKVSGKAELRRDRLLSYVEGMKAQGREDELAIPDHVLNQAKRIPYKRLSVQRLQGVFDSLKNIEHTARMKQKLRDAQAERDLREVLDEIGTSFTENVVGKPLNRVPTKGDRVMSEIKGYFNLVKNADTILRRIDGWKDRGPMQRLFKERVDNASVQAVEMRRKATEDLEEIFAVRYSQDERRRMSVRQKWDGYDKALSKWDIVSIALNMGNKDNLERLTSRDSRDSFSRNQIDTLVDNLDRRDWEFVQATWDYLDREFWPQIAAREERVTGVRPKKVEAQEVETKFGTFRGGYYPIVYDSRYSAKVSEDQNSDLMQSMMAGRFGKAQTKNGHTKERAAGGGGRTIQLGMQVLFGHINHVTHDLAFGEAVNTTWKLLQNPEVKARFEEANLLEDHRALELWIQDVAAGPAAGTHVLAGTMRKMKAGFTISKLAFNMSTVAIQVTGLAQSVALIGSKNMAKGVVQYVSSGPGMYTLARDIAERSTFMRERQITFQRDVFDLLNDTQLDPMRSRLQDISWMVMQAGFWAMQKVQYYAVDVPTWLGAHQQGLAQGMTDQEAAIHADRMVARAQASGLYADRTQVERGTLGPTSRQNEFLRLFTALGSYMFAKFNVANEVLGRAATDVRDPDRSSVVAVLKATTDLALLFVIEAILYNAVRGELPGQDEDDEDGWGTFLAKETALSIASVFPFIRDASSAVQGYGGGGAYGGISETFGRALRSAGDLVTGEANVKDLRAANDLLGLMAPGYPSTAAWRLIDGVGATGEEPSPLAVILGR